MKIKTIGLKGRILHPAVFIITEVRQKVEPHQAYISAYTTDYITDEQELVKYDALEQNLGSANNYLIFNAPEHLETANQLGDNWRYLEKMPVSGNANIYWEKRNKYTKTMKYGMLLHNPTDDTVNVTIHKKSAYTDAENLPNYRALLQIWDDYYAGYMTPDLTSISPQQNQLTLAPHSSEWIYLKDIPYQSPWTIFNGIINLTVQGGKTLDCYAFMMETEASRSRIEDDFNLYNRFGSNYTANYTSYVRADGGYGGIGGTANGPMLVNDNLDLSGRDWYKLLLTGNDAPYLNAGELMPLYYDGVPVPGERGKNAQNYSVIYKFNVSNFSGSRIYFQNNPLTNYNYLPDPSAALYVAYSIVQNGMRFTGSRVILTSTFPDFAGDFDVDFEEVKIDLTQPFSIEIIVSGMSSMPLTVIFE